MNRRIRKYFISNVLVVSFVLSGSVAWGQKTVDIDEGFEQHIFNFGEIEFLEDPGDNFAFDQITGHLSSRFVGSSAFKPEIEHIQSAYWYRIKIRQSKKVSKRWVLEFFDQTIDRIDMYMPTASGYVHQTLGDEFSFDHRLIKHKNFIFSIPSENKGELTYYFKIKSAQRADVLVVLRSAYWLLQYANNEYFFFGIFYGMILVFSLYNLLMYGAIREVHYLYYILYLLCIGLYEMSADGIAFQYLWPESPGWNQVSAGCLLYAGSTCALLFINSFLHLRENFKPLFKFIIGVFIFRTLFFILSVTVFPVLFSYQVIDVVPFAAAFYAAIVTYFRKYQPARFIIVSYSFLFFGITSRLLLDSNINWRPFGDYSHYSMGFGFIMEMVFLAFAISDKIRILRQEKEQAQVSVIDHLQENQRLQQHLNKNLEAQVLEKTKDLQAQATRIEQQNELLKEANTRLEHQSAEIARMNVILSLDNVQLKEDVAHVTEARLLSKDMDFDEFSSQYPDDESCLKLLADLKWKDGYTCYRCSHVNYSAGRSAHSRRCSKCGYEESATTNTLLQSTHLPINRAFYMVYLVYASKGSISSYKLSEILKIRQSTCWSYSSKIKKTLREKKKNGSLNESLGWSSLLLTEEIVSKDEN